MSVDRKVRLAIMVAPVAMAVITAVLATHGVTPSLDPIGMGPPT